jgi:leucyl aminopeptidase
MEFLLDKSALSSLKADVMIIGVFAGKPIAKQILEKDKDFPKELLDHIEEACTDESFKGKPDQAINLRTFGLVSAKKVIVRGLGQESNYEPSQARKLAANISRQVSNKENINKIGIALPGSAEAPFIQALAEGWQLGSYSFTKYKTNKEENQKPAKKSLHLVGVNLSKSDFDQAITRGKTIGDATNFARQLIAEPAGYLTPTRLSEEAKDLADRHNLHATIIDKAQIEKLQMGSFLGVTRGAKEPPKFIVLKYNHPKAKKTVALVGKGITFDSGGLSLKPAQSMETMKYDMAGAACVIATISAISQLKLPVNVVTVVAACENMPGGQAMHPGDVLKAMNGKTIEVNNTDAEGRLILADALTYVCNETNGKGSTDKGKVDMIIDVATLTGACVTALGRVAAGIMGNDDALIERIIKAGSSAGERLWQLPLFEEYKESLKSDIADLKNAGSRGEAGSSCAGMFLKEFVDERPWAHLDIAGPGWLDKERDECNKGGTGFGVRTLCHFIISEI